MKEIQRIYLLLYAFRVVLSYFKSKLQRNEIPPPAPKSEPEPVKNILIPPVFQLTDEAIDKPTSAESRCMCIWLTEVMDEHIYECSQCRIEDGIYIFCEEMGDLTRLKMKYMYPNFNPYGVRKDTEAWQK